MADNINTHTYYAHYERKLKQARHEINALKRYFKTDSYGNPTSGSLKDYVSKLRSHPSYRNPNDPNHTSTVNKLKSAEAKLDSNNPNSFISRYNKALQDIEIYPANKQELEDANEIFKAVDSKQSLFIMCQVPTAKDFTYTSEWTEY